MSSARISATPSVAIASADASTPPLCCDLCSWAMSVSEVVLSPDGKILGLLTCSACVEDALAARTLEMQA